MGGAKGGREIVALRRRGAEGGRWEREKLRMARMGADWEARAAEVGGRSVLCRAFRGERRPLAARRQAAALQAARRQAAALQWPFAVVVNLVD